MFEERRDRRQLSSQCESACTGEMQQESQAAGRECLQFMDMILTRLRESKSIQGSDYNHWP